MIFAMVGVIASRTLDGTSRREWQVHSIYDVLDAVREQPGLFIGSPNVTLLQGFLTGFRTSCDAFENTLDEPSPNFQRFHAFVARRLNRPSSELHWRTLLLEQHGDESAAFDAFFELLDAFRQDAT